MKVLRWVLFLSCFALMLWGIHTGIERCAPLLAGRTGAISVAAALGLLFLGDSLSGRIMNANTPGAHSEAGSGITSGDKALKAMQAYVNAQRLERLPLVLVTAAGTLLWAYSDLLTQAYAVCN